MLLLGTIHFLQIQLLACQILVLSISCAVSCRRWTERTARRGKHLGVGEDEQIRCEAHGGLLVFNLAWGDYDGRRLRDVLASGG